MASGGYDVKGAIVCDSRGPLKKPDLDMLSCVMCKYILRKPQQVITCGHRYCKECIEQLTNESEGPYTCHEDMEEFMNKDVRNDKACSMEIESLKVGCPNGCSWKGTLFEMEKHAEECPNSIQGCGEQVAKKDFNAHTSSICSKRPSSCQFSGKNVLWGTMEDCITFYEEHLIDCYHCKRQLPNKKKLFQHLEQECDMPHQQSDCQFKGKRSEMNQHISSTQMLKAEIQKHRSKVAMRIEESKRWLEKSHEVQSEEEGDSGTRQYSADWAQECTDAVDTAEKQGIISYPDSISNSRLHSQPVIQKRIDQSTCMKSSSLSSLTDYATAIEEVVLWYEKNEVKVTDGLFEWKIPDIRQCYQEAVDGKTISLYSPPFYTSPQGYSVCLRAYLNGNGDGKGTHISVFFFIMRSQHDDQLHWPFKHTVCFTLINQTNPAASITQAFVPDLHSPSFQQPSYSMNIPCGFPKFVQHRVLKDENFTGDNTLIIQCQIVTKGLSLQ